MSTRLHCSWVFFTLKNGPTRSTEGATGYREDLTRLWFEIECSEPTSNTAMPRDLPSDDVGKMRSLASACAHSSEVLAGINQRPAKPNFSGEAGVRRVRVAPVPRHPR